MKTGPTFIIALSSKDFEYSTYSRSFIRGAHLSTVQANYVVCDAAEDQNATEKLEIKQIPALLYAKDGKVIRAQFRGFEEDFVVAFINTNFISDIQKIETSEELDNFYASTAVGLIVAKPDASAEKYPEIAKFHKDFFFDTVVVFANPALFAKEGFYLYRYLDSTVNELPDLTSSDANQIAEAITESSQPEFSKINSYVAAQYERTNQTFAILMLAMDDFYLSQENLDLARNIKAQTGINVTYTDIENSQFAGMAYGLPDSLDSTMAIIDASTNRIFKYMLSSELTLENAVALIESVKEGKATPFWRSEIEPINKEGEIQHITANTLTQLIKDKKDAIIAVYYSSLEPIEPFLNATKPLVKDPKGIVYGKFSVALNDWSGPAVGDELPFIVGFKGGKVTYGKKMEETEVDVAKQIAEATAATDEL
jgi:thiol-disulfide isomerase/thioredoxin